MLSKIATLQCCGQWFFNTQSKDATKLFEPLGHYRLLKYEICSVDKIIVDNLLIASGKLQGPYIGHLL
jgi:hypothetical protein